MVLVRSHNGSALSSDLTATSGYRRYYAIASAPNDYFVSGGAKAWSRAAYASVGVKFKGLVNNGFEYIDGAQFAVAKYAAAAPLPFQPARRLNCTITPSRTNYCYNPKLQQNANGWEFTGTGTTIARDLVEFHTGISSLKVVTPGTVASEGATYTAVAIPDLRAGDKFSVSSWVKATAGVLLFISAQSTGAGFINMDSTPLLATGYWQQIVTNGATLGADCNPFLRVRTSGTLATSFWIDDQMIEKAAVVGSNFDGYSGPDFSWSGAVNASRSYYFPDKVIRGYLISQLLQENCPLGVTPGVPQFGLPT